MNPPNPLIESVLDRCEEELRRIDEGRKPAPADRSWLHLAQDARIPMSDWPQVLAEIDRRERARSIV